MTSSRPPRRALILIEVLAAAVLLAILGGVCASLLRSVRWSQAQAARPEGEVDVLDLDRFAGEFMAKSGPEFLVDLPCGSERIIEWGDADWSRSVRLRHVEPTGSADEPTHAWFGFTCGPWTVWRWVELPGKEPVR